MEKKKFRDCFSYDEYWMGMAFFLAAKSSSKHMMIAVENNQLIATSKEEPLCSSPQYEHHRQLEIDIIANCKNLPMCVVYCTFTPSYSMISNLACANLRRVIYYKTKDLSEDSQDLINHSRAVTLTQFAGNLNWMRDYIPILESSGIFA
jgi:hypothetical protein